MTTPEILDYMKLRLDVLASGGAPHYDDADYSIFFNKAQKDTVRKLYNPKANQGFEGAEETEKRSKELVQLKDTYTTATFLNGTRPNSYLLNLPDDYWLTLTENAIISYMNPCNVQVTDNVPVKPVKEDYYNSNIKNPYKRPYEGKIWRMDRERDLINFPVSPTNPKRHELILNSNLTPLSYFCVYYRIPKDVDLTNINDFCELDEMIHDVIADHAVQLMMQSTERPNLESKMIENKMNIQ
jgi:hypothetical protein